MTRSKSVELRAVIAGISVERMLLETDSPYLVPAKARGQRNEPVNLTYVLEALSRLSGIPEDEVASMTTANAIRLFGLSGIP
jgi:TatD DNase family protein